MATPGDLLPALTLPAVDGPPLALSELRGRIVVVDFWSAECAWSLAYDAWLAARLPEWSARGVAFVAVAANPNEDDERLRTAARERGLGFSLYRDPGQRLVAALGATHTPHVFVFDRAGPLVYRGAMDDRTFRRRVATVNYLERAVDALLAGGLPEVRETQPYGCLIVRAGDE